MLDNEQTCTLTTYFYFPKGSSSPYINHFVSADTMVPNLSNPQNWDRYSYGSNNPLRYIDPTGHDGIPVSKLNPFSYNTLQVTLHVSLEVVGGGTLDVGIAFNWKAMKNTITKFDTSYMKDFDGALVVSTSLTAGIEGEASAVGSLTGMDESVPELISDNVSTVFDGEIPINVSGCDQICVGLGGTVDVDNPNVLNSVSWSLGGGYGVEVGADMATTTDWLAYGSNNTTNRRVEWNRSPLDISEMYNEAWNDLKQKWIDYKDNQLK